MIDAGELQSVDGYMNIALERCTEYADGRPTRKWGDAFIRGNNGLSIRLWLYSVMLSGLQSHTSPPMRPNEMVAWWKDLAWSLMSSSNSSI